MAKNFKVNFTDEKCAALKWSGKGTDFYQDKNLIGFQLMVGKTKKTFRAFGQKDKRTKSKKIGEFPLIKVKDARIAAMAWLADFKAGKDPDAPESITLKDGFDKLIASRVKKGRIKPNTVKFYNSLMKNHLASWHSYQLASLTKNELRRKHEDLDKQPYTANAVVRLVGEICDFNDIEPNPARNIDMNPTSERPQSIEDFAAWYKKVSVLGVIKRNKLLFGALTGIRRENVTTLTWKQVDLVKATVFLPDTKTTKNVTLPLATQTVALLRELKDYSDHYVFPSMKKHGAPLRWTDFGQGGTFHDLRRFFTTCCAEVELPDYAMRALRGDRPQGADERYIKGVPRHGWAQRVADRAYEIWTGQPNKAQ